MSEKVASPNGFLSTPASSSSANPAFDVAMSIDKPAGDTASSMNPLPHHDSPPSSQGAPGRYNTLPTPYSPNQFAQYSFPHTPESPLPPSGTRPSFDGSRQLGDYSSNQTPRHVQMITPDSSPFGSRIVSNSAPQPSSRPPTTLPSSIPFRLAGSPTTSPPESVRSQATSPFMAKLLAAERQQRLSTPTSGPGPMQVDDVFSSSSRMTRVPTLPSISTPPTSPPLNISLSSTTPIPGAASHFSPPLPGSGGEIERIRYAIAQEQHELETRRPDYLQRHRRPESETPSLVETSEIPVHPSVGILESPTKGRRIKLFQETSEESFEESLMAGGYGRYRTAEWVRQPQPLLLTTPGSAGPSKMLSALEEVEEPKPLTEKEQKKRKRLDAFRSSSASHNGPSTLFPVELEGKGRVLLDIPNESVVEIHPRKRAATRRRKKGDAAKDALALSAPEEHVDIPNWPDAEFPWRLRTEERTELAKAEERERLTWIEKFLERDTDDEDDGEVDSAGREEEGDEAVIPSSKWGIVYEDATDRPTPARRGRGKMIPLSADPAAATNLNMERRRRSYFPSDPADARAALLSKRSVRALSYRREKRLRTAGHRRGQDRLCLCRGTDDGRELVQCDDCKMWYHLQCLGIRETSELGPEEEPWYCHDCNSGSRPSSPEPEDAEMPYREPTFAPTDETPRIRRTYDAPFLHSSGLQDSPLPSWNATRLPRTPVRGSRGSDGDVLTMAPPDPRYETPRNRRGPGDGYYDDLPFDPTSTPSRGIKLVPQPGFATPKTSLFSRSNGPFQTPRRPSGGSSRMPGPVSSVSSLDESPYGRFPVSGFPYDDSPVRHNTRRGSLEGPPPPRRVL